MSVADYHDLKLIQGANLVWDIGFDSSGDFILDDSFDINLIMSLFVDARAAQSEVATPLDRRGFWGDVILFKDDNDIESGSKLWLARGKRTDSVRNKMIDYSLKALQWLKSRNYAKDIQVAASYIANGIALDISIIIEDNPIAINYNFKLWENGNVQKVTPL